MTRHRFKQSTSLNRRHVEHAGRLRKQARGTVSGALRGRLLGLAIQAERVLFSPRPEAA